MASAASDLLPVAEEGLFQVLHCAALCYADSRQTGCCHSSESNPALATRLLARTQHKSSSRRLSSMLRFAPPPSQDQPLEGNPEEDGEEMAEEMEQQEDGREEDDDDNGEVDGEEEEESRSIIPEVSLPNAVCLTCRRSVG